MIILALDTATKTGFAIYNDRTIIESGVKDFKKKRGESNGLMFLRFRAWLNELFDLAKPDVVAYERAHHRGGAATEVCVNLTGRVVEICEERSVEYMAIQTKELKKAATGKGNAGKPEMIEAARVLLGRDPIDDNEADAVHLANFALNELNL